MTVENGLPEFHERGYTFTMSTQKGVGEGC